jgi:hypothetical protein
MRWGRCSHFGRLWSRLVRVVVPRATTSGAWIAIGVAVGVALGAAMDHVGAGIAIGVAIGAAMAGARGRWRP